MIIFNAARFIKNSINWLTVSNLVASYDKLPRFIALNVMISWYSINAINFDSGAGGKSSGRD